MNPAQPDLSSLIQIDDPIQTKINLFIQSLSELGLDKDQSTDVGLNVSTTATNQTMAKISSIMEDSDWERWKAFLLTEPNTAQQIIIMNEFLKKRINKDLNTLFNEILEGVMQSTKDGIIESRDLTVKISKLPPEMVSKAQQLLDEGEFDELDNILNSVN